MTWTRHNTGLAQQGKRGRPGWRRRPSEGSGARSRDGVDAGAWITWRGMRSSEPGGWAGVVEKVTPLVRALTTLFLAAAVFLALVLVLVLEVSNLLA